MCCLKVLCMAAATTTAEVSLFWSVHLKICFCLSFQTYFWGVPGLSWSVRGWRKLVQSTLLFFSAIWEKEKKANYSWHSGTGEFKRSRDETRESQDTKKYVSVSWNSSKKTLFENYLRIITTTAAADIILWTHTEARLEFALKANANKGILSKLLNTRI